MSAPRQITLARLAELGIVPDTRLGQHFLLDDNLVRVAFRLAELRPDDVVVEVGPGLGVMTAALADTAAFVHAIELDRRLEPALHATLAGRTNVALRFEDAVDLDPGSLDPPPTAFVSNLPYNVATPLIIESLHGMPTVERWAVMIQRELGDRLYARPGTAAYGAPSVLVQLACERTGARPVSRSVFVPQPRVDSMLVGFRRRPGFTFGSEWEWTARVVHGAFAHRRKTLANSLRLAGLPPPPAELAGMRAEQLAPERLGRLARELAA